MEQKIKNLLKEISILPQDSRRNNEVVELLRSRDIYETFEILMEFVSNGIPMLPIAQKLLNDRKVAEPYFSKGLEIADASTIKDWMEFAIPKIGIKRVVRILKQKESEKSGLVDKALYWLPILVEDKDIQIIDELKRDWEV